MGGGYEIDWPGAMKLMGGGYEIDGGGYESDREGV